MQVKMSKYSSHQSGSTILKVLKVPTSAPVTQISEASGTEHVVRRSRCELVSTLTPFGPFSASLGKVPGPHFGALGAYVNQVGLQERF